MSQEFNEINWRVHPEQEVLLQEYRDKWKKIVLSTEPIDRQQAIDAVKNAYQYTAISQKEPKIIFFDSYYMALKAIFVELREQLGKELSIDLLHQLGCDELYYAERNTIHYWQLILQLESELGTRFRPQHTINSYDIHPIQPELWANFAGYLDFCHSVENHPLFQEEVVIFLSLIKSSGWIFAFENICIICERPCKISFDNQMRLHAEGEPAIQFIDGYSLYSYYGVTLPEKYSKLHPNNWQSEWLLEEKNAELRRVLIQGIGYARIMQELDAIEINSYQEYSLLEVLNNIDLEPIYLLEMTCPSTGNIHVLRVPPKIKSAREAIRWVNWGIDPEDFAIQT